MAISRELVEELIYEEACIIDECINTYNETVKLQSKIYKELMDKEPDKVISFEDWYKLNVKCDE